MKMHNPLFLAVALAAKARIKEIDVHEAKQQIDSANPPVVVDVREDNEWATGHLPKAIHISKGVIERDIEKSMPDLNTPMILYCSGGYRSAVATDALNKMGYKNVCSMEGGSNAWQAAGYTIETT